MKRWYGFLGVSAGMFLVAQLGHAADKAWACSDGNWEWAGCWNFDYIVPKSDDRVLMYGSTVLSIGNATGTAYAADLVVDPYRVHLNEPVSVSQSGGTLQVTNNIFVGYTGTGSFSQAAGINSAGGPGGSLWLGHDAGARGTYNLSGSGKLDIPTQIIGVSGSGSFNQSGGSNVAYAVIVGRNAASTGNYALSGSASLRADRMQIGFGGSGSLVQTGGTNVIDNHVALASAPDSFGTYAISGGSLKVTNSIFGGGGFSQLIIDGGSVEANRIDNISRLTLGSTVGASGHHLLRGGSVSALHSIIGDAGTGVFDQWGGSHTVQTLEIGRGYGGQGTYFLSGGAATSRLTVSGDEIIGAGGTGGFVQSGGNHSVNNLVVEGTYDLSGGNLAATNASVGQSGSGTFAQSAGMVNVGNLYLGRQANGNGHYALGGSGVLHSSQQVIGDSGDGFFVQDGGTNFAGSLLLGSASGSRSMYELEGGSLQSSIATIGVEGEGRFMQRGGAHTVTSGLNLGADAGSSGTYVLEGGTLSVSGSEYIGFSGSGSFAQKAGSHAIARDLTLGRNHASLGAAGTYALEGGTLTVNGNEYIGTFGLANFVQTGGTHTVKGAMTLAQYSPSEATYSLQGGTLEAGSITVNSGGRFGFTGGTLSVGSFAGDLVNDGGTLAPGHSPGITTITGDYTQSALGAYAVEIGGLSPGEYDSIFVGGMASLDGLLSVRFIDLGGGLFDAHAGDTFFILFAENLSGTFGGLSLAALGSGLYWQIDYLIDYQGSTDAVRLGVHAIPEPETYAMMLAGLALLGLTARRRRQ